MSNQNAQIQRKIYEMYRTQTCSLCEISVKKQWSSQGCVARHLYSCYSVIPTHVHLSLNFPDKAHSSSTPSFSAPAFSAPPPFLAYTCRSCTIWRVGVVNQKTATQHSESISDDVAMLSNPAGLERQTKPSIPKHYKPFVAVSTNFLSSPVKGRAAPVDRPPTLICRTPIT